MSIFRADRKFERFEDVTPEFLRSEGIKLLLCDLDNTLRLHSEKEPTEELVKWINELRVADIEVVIISNNGRKKMMQKFCKPIKVECVWWARKPVSTKLTEARLSHGHSREETAMLGDKWSTDVLAAKNAGVRSYQVRHRKKVL
ncbi:HAD-IIIA family hydrolase [Candidatus Saccharibacteria bacterium]|nr:HAD-IIIA family hydrolase [Candidatus Saccharibacteria bacterium]